MPLNRESTWGQFVNVENHVPSSAVKTRIVGSGPTPRFCHGEPSGETRLTMSPHRPITLENMVRMVQMKH